MTDDTQVANTAETSQSCPTCAEVVHPGDQFCEACGVDLPADIASAPPPVDAPKALDLEGGTTATAATDAELGPTFHACGGTFVDGWCDTCGDREPDPRDHVEVELAAHLGAASDKGLRHRHNEDGFAVELLKNGTIIAVVCDGVSSTVKPDVASDLASKAAIRRLRADPTAFDMAQVEALAAVRSIDFTAKPKYGSPSCTFLAASIVDGHVTVAGLGDCRAYWVPEGGGASVLTSDDSWAQRQATNGAMTLEEAMKDRRAHVITRWLGRDAQDEWRPSTSVLAAAGEGTLVLCSDGLWNYLDTPKKLDEQIVKAGPEASATDVARHLVAYALDCGGHDNVTVVVAQITSVPAEHAPPDATDDSPAPAETVSPA